MDAPLPMSQPIGRFDFLPYGTVDERMEWHAANRFLDKVEQRSLEEGLTQRMNAQRAARMSHMDMIYRDKALLGVVCTTPRPDCLFVDALYVMPRAMDEEAQAALDEHLQRRAAQYGLDRLRMFSARRAALSMVEKHGWRLIAAQYEKKVNP